MNLNLLLVDDDRAFAEAAGSALVREGFSVTTAHALHGARLAVQRQDFDVVLLDRRLPDGDGLPYLKELLGANPGTAVVMVTADDDLASAVDALRQGARDYLVKPVNLGDLIFKARRACEERQLRQRLERAEGELSARHRLVPPASPAMKEALELLERIAARPRSPVLILGETGVGKEVLARRLHQLSCPSAPFVHLNCAAINEHTAESELFGHERGSFTDARSSRKGLVEVASGGTLFLDEVGELPPPQQAKLLTFLDSGEFRRLGGAETRTSTARIIAATNRDLEAGTATGAFRSDLWFRLSVFKVVIPPLRERREDVAALAESVLEDLRQELGRPVLRLGERGWERLRAYPFYGNVRELKNVLERAAVVERGPELTLDFLKPEGEGQVGAPARDGSEFTVAGPPITLEELQNRYVAHVAERLGGKRMEAAEILGISYPTLAKRLGPAKKS
ncbi:MAG TPA: sigma-54 dependent transcriptional regulator [Myxococcales bacterium]|jgi:two-component system response regulator AtoC